MQKAAKRPKSTHKQKPINQVKRVDRIVLVVTLAVLAVGTLFYLWGFVYGGLYTGEKAKMETYLKDKYNKEFRIYDIKTHSCGLGCQGEYGAKAHPVSDKTLSFDLAGRDGYYSDEYPGAVWAREEHANLKPFLTEVFGYTPEYKIDIHTAFYLNGKIKGEFGHFNEAALKYGDKITMTVLIIPSIDREIISWDELAKKSYRVIEYLQNLGTTPTFRYESTVNGFSVDDIDLVNIKSHQDLIKYIKEYN